jgi:hypothetical protein
MAQEAAQCLDHVISVGGRIFDLKYNKLATRQLAYWLTIPMRICSPYMQGSLLAALDYAD